MRAATAVGAGVMVAGTTFGVAAFADSGVQPEQAASNMTPQEPRAEQEAPFFPEVEEASDEEREAQIQAAVDQRDSASGAASVSAAGSVEEEQKEEEPAEEPVESDSGGDSGGSAAPSGDPKSIAQAMLADYGWGADQFSSCLEPLWEKESNWDPSAQNPSSGAYGIPQALPGNKMASAGSDWQSNPATQIEWGLGYIEDRYGSPCEAWSHSQSVGWY
ncbi:hypothetical protein HDA32_000727 [Spinactinospora alkalitolerans]|uniref:Transglycosylase SLT domain-containing protein n=1 Tax=Spinactinospora alkalitolerans TaxID=687207 RepID=A0A852TQN8_9ACTN|nr:hypothetical protein [Spinactinospora alkalitolerans]